jgi:hypothetical protein
VRGAPLIPACIALCTGLATAGAVSGFVPDPAGAEHAVLDDRTWIGSGPTWELRVTMLTDAERQEYVHRLTGVEVDPFATRPDAESAYLTWHLELTNRGGSALPFRPQAAWLVTSNARVEHPIGMETLHGRYRTTTGRDLPAAYARVGSAFLEADAGLDPGDTVSGLLVYQNVGPRTRKFWLDVPLTLPSGDWVRVRLPYRREKPGKREGR